MTPRCLLALSLILAPASGSRLQDDASVQAADARLDRMLGEFEVHARFWRSPATEPESGRGTATWTRSHGGRCVHEQFRLEHEGREIEGDAWIAWRPRAERYELTQIDGVSPSTVWLVGGWDAERERIALHDVAEVRLPGRPEVRCEYRFEDDGSFVKELLVPDGAGGFRVVSDYRYVPQGSHASQAGPTPPRATELEGATSVPMIEGFPWVVVDVELNGQGPFRMILDTGAGTTVLNADLVQELGLASEGSRRIGNPASPEAHEVDVLSLETVRVGSATFHSVAAVGWRGGGLVSMGGIRGVLGFPTFAECLLTLDYPGAVVEVARADLPEPNGETVLPMKSSGSITIPIEVAGFPFEAHLDTGNAQSLVLPQSWMERMPLTDAPLRQGRGMRGGSPAAFMVGQLDAPVKIGAAVVDSPTVTFDAELEHVNVGREILGGFRIALDQRNGRFGIEVPGAATPVEAATMTPRRMGVQMAARGGAQFSVDMVVPGSAGEAAGLKPGDVLLEVDGEPFTQDAMLVALRGTAPVTITIERDGERQEVTLFEER